jgi:pilus assembly protein CpaF
MIAMSGIEMPLKAVRAQIASAVNLIVQASRLQDGSRRMVSITEVTGMEGEVISMQEVFRYERLGPRSPTARSIGHFTACGVRSALRRTLPPVGLRPAGGTIYEPDRRRVSLNMTLSERSNLRLTHHLRHRLRRGAAASSRAST